MRLISELSDLWVTGCFQGSHSIRRRKNGSCWSKSSQKIAPTGGQYSASNTGRLARCYRENSHILAFHHSSIFGPFVRSGALMNSFYCPGSVGSGSALVPATRQCRCAILIVVVGAVAMFGMYE